MKQYTDQMDQFLLRYYYWGRRLASSEVHQNFPLLRGISRSAAGLYINFLSIIPAGLREDYSLSVLKRAHPRGLELDGETLTNQDQHRIEEYQKFVEKRIFKEAQSIVSRPAKRGTLRKQLAHALNMRDLGLYTALGGGGGYYAKRIGDFLVITQHLTASTQYALSFSHSITTLDRIPLFDHFSILHCLGVASQIMVERVAEEEVDALALSVVNLVDEFMTAAPSLLSGLNAAQWMKL